MPEASKMKVFTSASAPWAGISWPFQRKVTPAALPIFATIWRVARMGVWAGAMRGSWLAGWSSAVTEIQEVSVARITRVMGAAAVWDEAADFAVGKVRVITSGSRLLSSLLASLFLSLLASLFLSASFVVAALLASVGAAGGFAGWLGIGVVGTGWVACLV